MIPLSTVALAAWVHLGASTVARDGQTVLDRFRAAYSIEPRLRIEYREAAVFGAETPPSVIELARKTPGVTEIKHPLTGETAFCAFSCVCILSGAHLARLEKRNLFVGGDPARSTWVYVWNDAYTASVASVGAKTTDLHRLPVESGDDWRKAFQLGQFRVRRAKTDLGFWGIVQYASDAVQASNDIRIEGDEAEDKAATVRCADLGVTLTIDRGTGELMRLREELPSGDSTTWAWSGRLDGAWFPARHPRVQTVVFVHVDPSTGARTTVHGDVLLFDAIAAAPSGDESMFLWTSLAPKAVDVIDHVVITPDGAVDAKATAKLNAPKVAPAPPMLDDARRIKPDPSRFVDRMLVSAGVVGVAGGALLWIRRRSPRA